ncbi:putative two-component system, sensor histidine kinase [Erysipelothrix rhusiopathiae SY1027]|nr:putative two-component system, sensor histidine kinase [Erysipelothrix rhusiopathiae SY1027]
MKHSKSSFLFGIALSIGYVVIIAYYVINLSNLPDQYRLEESKAVEKN